MFITQLLNEPPPPVLLFDGWVSGGGGGISNTQEAQSHRCVLLLSLSVVLGLLLGVLIQLESIVIDLCVPCAHWAWIHQIFPSFQTQ